MVAANNGVQVQRSSIGTAWNRAGGDDTWLMLRTKSGSIEDFAAALDEANLAAEARGEGEHMVAEAPTSTPLGFALLLRRATWLPSAQRWAEDFGAGLEARGFTGTLGGAPKTKQSPYLFSAMPPVPTGYVAWVLDRPAIATDPILNRWHVTPEATARITTLAQKWARLPNSQLVLSQNLFSVTVDLDDASEPLTRAIYEYGFAGLQYRIDAEKYATHVALAYLGDGVFQVIGGPDTWQQRIDRLRQAITALPADTEHAYIRPALRNENSHSAIDNPLRLPGITESHVRYNKHLLGRYLPDAHGVQVVRTAHLDNAHDLTAWDITDLGHGRHLVQARDLTPWYSHTVPDPDPVTPGRLPIPWFAQTLPDPDPEVLAQARADFAGALLTEQIIADNPSPWQQ